MDGTVLVADDDRTIRTVLTQALTRAGCKVHATSSLVTLMRWVDEGKGDLVISDVMMPLKDGFELTQAIRTHVNTSHIPIILLTAKASLDSRLEGIQRGADVYLIKPFSPEELTLRIKKLIDLRRLLQERYQNGLPISRKRSITDYC